MAWADDYDADQEVEEMLWTDPFAPFLVPAARTAAFSPATDVTVSDGDVVLTLDLPGLTAEDLSIELVDDVLTVRGERKRAQLPEGAVWAHAERAFGAFERRLKLPAGVDPDAIMASMEHGVLSLIVPKPERLKRRTISVSTGEEQRELEPAAA